MNYLNDVEQWFETTHTGRFIMKAIKIYLIALLMFSLGQGVFAQFGGDKFTETANYCHIDLMKPGQTLHRDYSDKIEISPDKVIIFMEGDSLVYNLGTEIAPGVRIARRADKPGQRLAARYISGKMLAIINMDTGAGVMFILDDICATKPETEDKGWYEVPK